MRIYLDNSATTPPYPEVIEEMSACMLANWGNPSTLHSFGRDAYDAMSLARERVGAMINADPSEIYFTSGGTEADNLALRGVAARFEQGHIITTAIEHAAVLNSCKRLEDLGFEVTHLTPDESGRISAADVEAALRPDTLLVSVMHANNEIGSIQPIAEIGEHLKGGGVLLHTDAVQSVGKIPVDVQALGVDMLTVSAHKINGPKGVGALYVRHGADLEPLILGGGQERTLRSGTENMPGIVGFGKAAELTAARWQKQIKAAESARNRFLEVLQAQFANFDNNPDAPSFVINGSMENRLPNNLNLSFAGIDSAALLLMLDMAGVAASAASACSSGNSEPSHVLQALNLPQWRLRSALRLTFGWQNTLDEAETAAKILASQVQLLQRDVQ
jgi:cysteine desulfurase